MIEQMTYSRLKQNAFNDMLDQQQNDPQKDDLYYDETNQFKNSKKQAKQLKFIKQLKARDIKLSHKKFQLYPNKASSTIKNISSMQNNKQVLQQQNSLAANNFTSEQLKKSNKYRHNYLIEKQKEKQKEKIPVEVISNFNPENMISKQASIFIHDKLNKKGKMSQIQSSITSKIRQSRSQNKKQKNINTINNMQINTYKNFTHQNQGNIFQNLDLISKQNSHHSLDKNSQFSSNIANSHVNSKLQEKLHLPSLVNQGTKSIRSKLIHNSVSPSLMFQNNDFDNNEKQYTLAQKIPLTENSSPYLHKIVKIPIDRLKPLKPQQIKLKYQRKVKQEQKNRAKQIALHIFQKQQQQAQKFRNKRNETQELQSDQNLYVQNQNKRFVNVQVKEFRNKTSIIKKQKLIANNNKEQNIFKKHLVAYNGNSQL